MAWNILKSVVHGYNHNAPSIRDKGVAGAYSATNNLANAPTIKGSKATKQISYKHNAPELIKQPSGNSFGN